jgi:hypothetical protein
MDEVCCVQWGLELKFRGPRGAGVLNSNIGERGQGFQNSVGTGYGAWLLLE